MAFYNDKEDEDAQNQTTPGAQTSGDSGIIDGAGGGAAPTSAAAPKAQGAPDKSGNFVGIKQYLDANKSQAGKLGDQTAGVINQSADAARQGVSGLTQEANEKVKGANLLDQDTSNTLKNGAENLSDQQKNTIKQTQTARYGGPADYTSLNSYQNAADTSSKAAMNIDNSGTEQGRMNLVSQINSKPRTQGENIFDNALLQAGGGREKIGQAATANQDVKGALDTAKTNITNQIGRADDPSTPDVDESTGAIGQTNKAQADASKQVQDAMAAWRAGFEPKVANAQKGLTDAQNRVTQDIGDNPFQLSDETLKALGLDAGSHVYDLDLSSYLNPASPSDITAANVATPEDYARYGALADLSGDQTNFLNQANASQAGTAPGLSANTAKLQSDIKSAQSGYDQKYKTQVLNATSLPGLAPVNTKGYGGLALHALGKTPEYIENVLLPQIKNNDRNAFPDLVGLNSTDFQNAYNNISGALNNWKKNQYYTNVVNPTA